MNITSCRYCGSSVSPVIDLGRIALVNYFPTKEELKKEKTHPLRLVICNSCGLLQLDEIVPASEIFSTYHYVTGASEPLISELSELASQLISSQHLTKKSRVLDIGSNDGTLLSFFHAKGIHVLGVEPSKELSAYSSGRGITTMNTFFTSDVAKHIVDTYGLFDVVCATHVLANIIDLADFMDGIKTVLSPKGVCVIEVADAEVMIQKGQFDAIYHEHYSYFTQPVLERITMDHGLTLKSVTRSDVQGGAIRISLAHASHTSGKKQKNKQSPLDIQRFTKDVTAYKKRILSLLKTYKGKKIVGFGAPAKSVTFTSFIGLSEKQIGYIVDSTAQKQGKFLPGTEIPIYAQSHLAEDPPAVVIVFSWNYRDTILRTLRKTLNKEAIIIIPFPTVVMETV